MGRRIASLVLAAGCGAGQLDPFASGDEDGSADDSGSASVGDATNATTSSTGEPSSPGGVVYVRCPRTAVPLELSGTVTVAGRSVEATRTFHHVDVYDRLPGLEVPDGMVAPCDLVLRAPDGAQTVLYDCASSSTPDATCAAIDPAVDLEGERVAFVVVRGAITRTMEQYGSQVLDPDAEPAALGWVELPNPRLSVDSSELHVIDLASGEDTVVDTAGLHVPRTPMFTAGDRIILAAGRPETIGTIVRAGAGQGSFTSVPYDLFSVAATGGDQVRLGSHAMSASAGPMQLVDGRVAVVSTQRVGLQAFRHTDGTIGWPGAFQNVEHLYAQDPDGARYVALFGQHTHFANAFSHSAIGTMTQLGDGRIAFVEGGSSVGANAGPLWAFAVDGSGLEGPAPHSVDPDEVFRPTDLVELAPWIGRLGGFDMVLPEPAVVLPGYGDPQTFSGGLRDPAPLPGSQMLVTWAKGPCTPVATAGPAVLGDPPPPVTSGQGGLAPLNALEWIGRDNPGCDLGVHVATAPEVGHPSTFEVVADLPEFHELMARPIQRWAQVHGDAAPAQIPAAHRRAAPHEALPFATPFALLGGSSLLDHETRSVDGNAFGSEIHWARQGAHTAEWADDEVCGVRISALVDNRPGDAVDLFAAMGHRVVVLAELPVRKSDGGRPVLDPLGDPDTSFRLRVPADTPLVIASVDCEGRALTSSQVPFSLRPGEDRTCGGCHVRSRLPLRFDETAAASLDPWLAGGPEVPLLAGGTPDAAVVDTLPGFGATWEFTRDVWPILQTRCVSCHTGEAASAGLRFDLPGIDDGSTWWRLAADFRQTYVPVERQTVAGSLRKPQLSRYVRFFAARGSLLYWKAANARTDGRTDADADDDVDFVADHPTEITPEELRVIARWIDTGVAGGAVAISDVAAPILVARISDAAPTTLVVGTADVGDGIAPESLSVQWSVDGVDWTEVAASPADVAGTTAVDLAGAPEDAWLRIAVEDAAGNATRIERWRPALREP